MPTSNTYIGPSDGWVQVGSANPKFIRTSGVPHTHPYYVYAGSSAPSGVGASASQTVIFATGVPTANQIVTVNGNVFTFKASRAAPFQVTIGVDNAATAANFRTAVNLDLAAQMVATLATATVTLTLYAPGTAGNAYTLSTNGTNVSVGGALFTGGLDIVEGVLVCHHPFKVNVTMAEKLFVRVPNPVPNSRQANGKLRIDTFYIA